QQHNIACEKVAQDWPDWGLRERREWSTLAQEEEEEVWSVMSGGSGQKQAGSEPLHDGSESPLQLHRIEASPTIILETLQDIWNRVREVDSCSKTASNSNSSNEAAGSPIVPPVNVEEQLNQMCLDIWRNIPQNEEGHVTSVGSVQHSKGTCSPCAYWFKGICKNGLACRHCHFLHDGQRSKRLRPSKQARQRQKLKAVDEDDDAASQVFSESVAGQDGRRSEDGRGSQDGRGSSECALPTAPGPVSTQLSAELQVTMAMLQRVAAEHGFQVSQPPPPEPASSKLSL
ncbi:unnamed protein product, partial [Polarella glacialis]